MPTTVVRLVATAALTCAVALPAQQDQCRCEVVNRADVTTASGSCTLPGQGSVPCVSAALGSIPGAINPAPGTCEKKAGEVWICGPDVACTYSSIRMVVTPTACANHCFGQTCAEAKIDGASFSPPIHVCAGGNSVNIDVSAGSTSNQCGTPDTDRYVRLSSTKGAVVFEIRYRFGCHQCSAIAGDG